MIRKIKDFFNNRPDLKKKIIPFFLIYRKFKGRTLSHRINSGLLLNELSEQKRNGFINRSNVVKDSPDNSYINRVPNAGKVKNGWLIMHNGLKVDPFSYYGEGPLHIIVENEGVHEPQEERVFASVLKNLPEGATMIELGSFWSFYSMWFNTLVKDAKNYMIEPDPLNLEYGKINFKANGLKAKAFYQAFIGSTTKINDKGQKTVCIDDFVEEFQIPFIDVLHSDVQGYELDMLKGAVKTLEAKKIGYAFISTHSNPLHYDCMEFLKLYGFSTIASADKNETYSFDGVLVMKAPYYKGINPIEISLRKDLAIVSE
jgi:hypothetical protein